MAWMVFPFSRMASFRNSHQPIVFCSSEISELHFETSSKEIVIVFLSLLSLSHTHTHTHVYTHKACMPMLMNI
jgi:hypothetical protein